MGSYRIAAIPADGIGPEVIGAGIEVLGALQRLDPGLHLEFTHFPWGSDYYRAHGVMMPEDGLDALRSFHSVGVTCLISTHDDQILDSANRVVFLDQGRVVETWRKEPMESAA